MKRVERFSRVFGITLLAAALSAAESSSQENSAEKLENARIGYIRVELPTADADQWHRFKFGYEFESPAWPIDEFRDALEAANADPRGTANSVAAPRITAADYSARLDGDVLAGSGHFDVRHEGDAPGYLPLDGCRIALANARWEDHSAARLGAGSDGQLGAAVEQGGKLHFDWSLLGTRDATGVVRFAISLPKATRSRMTLDVPQAFHLILSHGVIESKQPLDGEHSRFSIALGGRPRTELLLVPGSLSQAPSGPVIVQQRSHYELSKRGLSLRAQLKLHVPEAAFTAAVIAIDVDPPLQPISVTLDGRSLPWRPDEDGARIHVKLNQPLPPQSDNLLEVTAIAALVLAEAQRLPAIRCGNMPWLSDSAALAIDTGLLITRLDVEGGDVTRIAGTPHADSGTTVDVRLHRQAGRVTLAIDSVPQTMSCEREFAWKISEEHVAGRLSAFLRSTHGEIYDTTFAVPAYWSFAERDVTVFREGKDGQSAEAVAHSLYPPSVQSSDGQQVVRLSLAQPVRPGEPLRVEIKATRDRPLPNSSIPLEHLDFAQWPAATPGQTLAALVAHSPLGARVIGGAGLKVIPVENLRQSTLDWLQNSQPSVVVASNDGLSGARLHISQGVQRVRASMEQRAMVTTHSLGESYDVECVPEAAGVDRVRVMFWPPRETEVQWSFPSELAQEGIEARRIEQIAEQPQPADLPEVWEIALPARRSQPFQFSARRDTSLGEGSDASISLMSVAGAVAQSGRVVVVGHRGAGLSITAGDILSVAPSRGELHLGPEEVVWGAYRYAPTQALAPIDARISVALAQHATNKANAGNAFAWRMLLMSTYAPGDFSSHRAMWWVNHEGKDAVNIDMPRGCRVDSIAVDGVQQLNGVGHDENLSIAISHANAQAVVIVDFSMPQSRWGVWNNIAAPMPIIDVNVLQQRWLVAPPGGYAMTARGRSSAADTAGAGIVEKFLGAPPKKADTADMAIFGKHAADPRHTPLIDDLHRRLAAPGATWGQALLGSQLLADGNSSHPRPLLLIDAPALSSIGIEPGKLVLAPQSAPSTLGDLFAASGIVLVLANDSALLTDAQFIQHHRNRFSPTNVAGIWRIADERLESFFRDGQTLASHYVTPQVWASALSGSPSTKRDDWRCAMGELFPSGAWSGGDLYEPGVRVTVYHRTSVRALGLAALLGGVVLSLCIPLVRPHWLAAVAFLLACATVVLDGPWHLPTWGAAAGIALGGALTLARRRPAVNRTTSVGLHRARGLTLIALLVVGVASIARADDSATVYPVWFPIDDKGQSTGVVHLPKPLAEVLQAKAKAKPQPQREWLIDRADYKIEFQWDTVDQRLEPGDLQMEFDVIVLDDISEVELPLPRGELALPEQWATLNGEAIEPNWRLGQTSIRIPVGGVGRHHLKLRIRPSVRAQGGDASIAVAVPPIPQATLSIVAPVEAPRIDVGDCLGQIKASPPDDREQQLIEASVGAVDILSIRWTRRQSAQFSDAKFDVDELLWLKLDQESTALQARFQGKILQGEMTHLLIEADRRLKLQAGDAQRSSESETGDKAVAVYRLPLALSEDGFTASATFQLPQTPSAGQYALPLLRPLQANRRRRWLAVDAPQHVKSASGIGMAKMKTEEFTNRWPEESTAPQAAYSCDLRQPARLIALTPSPQALSLSEATSCLYSRRSVEINYRATVEPGARAGQLLTFTVPAGVLVESVTAKSLSVDDTTQSEAEAAHLDNVAWWGIDQRQLQVFLRAAPVSPYELAIFAKMPVAAQRRSPVPVIQPTNANLTGSRVEVRRKPDVLVDVVRHPGFATLDGDDALASHASRRVALLEAQLEPPSAQSRSCVVQVRPNQLTASGTQLTHLVSSQSVWRLQVDINVHVRAGRLDALEFEVPARVAEAISIQPPQSLQVLPTLEGRSRRLVITPDEPIDGRYQASLIATDVIPPGGEVRVPDIRPLTDIPLARYLAVPTSFESRDIAWETDGLQRVGEAAIGSESDARFADAQLFQVVAEPPQATLRSLTEVAGVPLVRLADVHFAWDAGGQCFAKALIDLEPAGLTECVVELPEAMRLGRLRIDDLPAQAIELSGNRWRLKLQSTKLPQRIEIIYGGQIDWDGSPQHVVASAPALSDIAIERTLWTVYAPAEAGEPVIESHNLSPSQQSVIRLRAMTDIIHLPRHVRLEYSSSETQDWLAPWQARWRGEHRRLGRGQLVQAALSPGAEQLRLHDVDFNFHQAVEELELSGANAEPLDDELLPAEDHFRRLVTGKRVATRRMVKGTSRRLAVRFQPPAAEQRFARYSAALAFLIAAGLAWLSPRWLPRSDWPLRCGHGIALVVAIVAALALWPSLLFWSVVLLLIAGWIWLRRGPRRDPLLWAILVQAAPPEGRPNADNA